MKKITPTRKWRKMQPIYRYFAGELDTLDFSEESCLEMFLWETYGEGDLSLGLFSEKKDKFNGYAVGKHWMDATVKMWNEDIASGILLRIELFNDPELKDWHWWLEKVCPIANNNWWKKEFLLLKNSKN